LLYLSNNGVVILFSVLVVLLVGFAVELVHESLVVTVGMDCEVIGEDEWEGGNVTL